MRIDPPAVADPLPARHAVRMTVRSYEVDVNGHLNHANYHRFGEHARSEHLAAAGLTTDRLVAGGLGPVLLETHCRFLRELRAGDEVEVDSRIDFGAGRTFDIAHSITRVGPEPEVAAEITCLLGVLDQQTRRLVHGPRERLVDLIRSP